MSDERIEWSGHPSHARYFWQYTICVLLCWLIVPVFYALWLWLDTRTTVYTLTDQRLKTSRGIFNKLTDDVELYRVRDSRFQQSFFERMFGAGEIVLLTTDESSPEIRMAFIKNAEAVRERIRALVEARRDAKRVRTIDSELGGHANLE